MATEPIYAALFALAAGAVIGPNPAFVFTARRIMAVKNLVSQPALLMRQLEEEYEGDLNRSLIVRLRVEFWIFALTGEPIDMVTPATTLNVLKDALLAAVAPPGYTYPNQTLGGLVSNAWVQGKGLFDEGPIDQQGIVMIPMTILAMDAGA